MVALSTALGLAIAPLWGNGPVDLLYLPAVLGAAVLGGLRPALFAAVASTLAYNYFFTAPFRTLMIHSAADVVTVAVLFAVAVVTSHLAGSLRRQARLAAAHAARNATIAGLARRLLSCSGESDIADIAVTELARLFDCNAVLAADSGNAQLLASAPGETVLAPSDLAAASMTLTTGEAAGRGVVRANLADWTFYPIASDVAVLAAAGLARNDGLPPVTEDQRALLGNLLDQVALALERARFERDARDSIALRERDKLRSALLSSIGEDVKPRLAAITAAARALKRVGTADKAEVSTVADEAAKEVISIRKKRPRGSRQSRGRSTDAPSGPADVAAPEVSRPETHRVFEDARGVQWDTCAIHPSAPVGRVQLPEPYRSGWLFFDSATEKRRLSPIPEDWHSATDDMLRAMCAQAEIVPERTSARRRPRAD